MKISTKIYLNINRSIRDLQLEKKIPNLSPVIRLECKIRFKTKESYSQKWKALIDTGAHTSILPFHIWKNLDTEVLAEHRIGGLIPKKECRVAVLVAKIKAKILDEKGNESDEIKFLSYLAYHDNIPLILGLRDLLEKFNLNMDFINNKAFLERKKRV